MRTMAVSMALSAVLLPLGIAVALSALDASVSPTAGPEPLATAPPGPSVVAIESPAPGDADDSATGPEGSPASARLTVEAGDLWFAPDELSIPSDGPTVLELVGVGRVAHNLIVDELGLQLHVGPDTSSEVAVRDLPPGTYQFYCSIYGHRRAGMYGTLTIE